MSLEDKLSKKPKIGVYGKSYSVSVTFQEVADIQNNKKNINYWILRFK